ERYDISAQLSVISKLTILSCQVVLVLLNYQIEAVFQGVALIMGLILLVEISIVKVHFHKISFMPYFDKATFQEVFSYGLWSWIQSIFIILASQLENLLLPL